MATLGLHPTFATPATNRFLEGLGLNPDFSKKTYEGYIADANVFSKVGPASIVHWFLNNPRIYTRQEFKNTHQDSYLQICFSQKKEPDSEVSLEWAKSLLDKKR